MYIHHGFFTLVHYNSFITKYKTILGLFLTNKSINSHVYRWAFTGALTLCPSWLPQSGKWRGTCPSCVYGSGAYGLPAIWDVFRYMQAYASCARPKSTGAKLYSRPSTFKSTLVLRRMSLLPLWSRRLCTHPYVRPWKPTFCDLSLLTIANDVINRAVRKSRIHDRRDYRDFRRVPWFLATGVISCHSRKYWCIN